MRSTTKAAENLNSICAQTPLGIPYNPYIIGLQYYMKVSFTDTCLYNDSVGQVLTWINSFIEESNYENNEKQGWHISVRYVDCCSLIDFFSYNYHAITK